MDRIDRSEAGRALADAARRAAEAASRAKALARELSRALDPENSRRHQDLARIGREIAHLTPEAQHRLFRPRGGACDRGRVGLPAHEAGQRSLSPVSGSGAGPGGRGSRGVERMEEVQR